MAFFELNIAMTGLFAAQRGLQVTSNNISNANTTGYSRQLLSQKASTPLSGLNVGMTGTGVTTTGVNRVRDSFIDNKLWSQNPQLGEYNVKVTQNSMIEVAFGEPSENGFTKIFSNMFSAMSTLSTNPSSSESKTVVREEMTSFAKYFNNIASTLEKQQKDLNFEVKGMVSEINSLATRIQSLNRQIFDAELYGNEASSFRDERDNCIDRLSQIVDTEVEEEDFDVKGNTITKYTVRIAGQTLVDHVNVNTLEVVPRETKQNERDIDGLYDIVWNTGNKFDGNDTNLSGELKGLLDMRDGAGTGVDSQGVDNENKYNGIPYYLQKLDDYVRTFAQTMNEQYSTDANGYVETKEMTLDGESIKHIKRDDAGSVTLYKEGSSGLEAAGTIKKEMVAGQEVYKLVNSDGDDIGTGLGLDSDEIKAMYNNITPKIALFTYTDGNGGHTAAADIDYSKLTASNFGISKEISDSANNMKTVYDGSGKSDTTFMLALIAQKDNVGMFDEGTPKDYMTSIFAELGINAKEATMYQETQVAVTNNLKNQRLQVSQVDTTEEFTYMIKYQQAYQSAAKIMNTIDGIYETTIFKLGNF